jgi:hypothetical protein
MHGRFGRVDREPIHHLDCGRHDAARDDRRDRRSGRVDRGEAGEERRDFLGTPQQPDRRLRDDCQRAFRSDDDAEKVEARRIEHGAADVHDLPVRQHGLEPSTWCTVKPYFRQCAPPEFSAMLPPIEHTIWLEGSGA